MILTPAQQARVAALVTKYAVTQEDVARTLAGKGRSRSGRRVDRSLVSKIWRGHASSRFVMQATFEALLAKGWPKPVKPALWAHMQG